ncbi:MAG: TonB family protein [Terriglobales bacterium]
MPITLKDDSNLEAQNAPPVPRTDVKQRRRMLVALAVLLAAVVVVFIRDRELWFSSGSDSEINNQSAAVAAPGPAPSLPPAEVVAPVAAPSTPKKQAPPRVSSATDKTPAAPVITATDRAVLPPLEVEVVAGNQRQALAASNSSVKVEMQPAPAAGTGQISASAPAQDSNSDAHVSLSPNTTERVARPVEPNYPLLAKQMKVQGAVVLQALIDKTGNIQDLHVVSGPTILAAAAREAVKQWHFKPYYQGGQPVETEARITVNFTISTY